MSDQINVDYIGIVTESTDKTVSYKQIQIENDYVELTRKLNDMIYNANVSVLDMQVYFEREFKKGYGLLYYNYCYPYSYDSSYIDGAKYPQLYNYSEYQEMLKKTSSQTLKQKFASQCNRYIQAYIYNRKLVTLKQNNANKMFSTENIGWTYYSYTINQDIKIELRSNFGYGTSSYFFVNLSYKGIDILPYSYMVRYFKANMADFIRYTRNYEVERSSWKFALSFVAETSNFAICQPENFVSKWIINEVDDMMSGLNRLAENPHHFFENYKISRTIDGMITVRNISEQEKNDYYIYPKEMDIAKQAEKISGALLLLQKLEPLISIYPKIESHIQSIKDLNRKLLPSFRYSVTDIKDEIKIREQWVQNLKNEKEILEQQCQPDFDEIKRLKQEEEKESQKYVYESDIRNKYCQTHNEFKKRLERISILSDEIYKKQSDIFKRNGFAEEISNSIKLIENKLELIA